MRDEFIADSCKYRHWVIFNRTFLPYLYWLQTLIDDKLEIDRLKNTPNSKQSICSHTAEKYFRHTTNNHSLPGGWYELVWPHDAVAGDNDECLLFWTNKQTVEYRQHFAYGVFRSNFLEGNHWVFILMSVKLFFLRTCLMTRKHWFEQWFGVARQDITDPIVSNITTSYAVTWQNELRQMSTMIMG